MRSLLCCLAASTLGWFIIETPGTAGVWAGVLGGLLLPLLLLWLQLIDIKSSYLF